MTTTPGPDAPGPFKAITRRQFLRLAAMGGLLAGCGPVVQSATPASVPSSATSPPRPTDKPAAPTKTPAPTVSPTISPKAGLVWRPDIIKMYPAVPSRVVQAHHAGVWAGDRLVPAALRQMLDASITKLTGLSDAKQAWLALFQPNERIAIKVNAFANSVIWTHVPLVLAVTQSLQDAGIPAEHLVVFDYTTDELKTAGFAINPDGPGVRCYGTDGKYTPEVSVGDSYRARLSQILADSDALINIPVLKSHMISGLTFALKNHYGTVESPSSLHMVDKALPALNILPQIKDRTRLVVGDILEACLDHTYSWPYWKSDYKGDSILMSFDPIAHDTVGFDLFKKLKAARGEDSTSNLQMAQVWMANAGKLGLGANDLKNIEIQEIKLG